MRNRLASAASLVTPYGEYGSVALVSRIGSSCASPYTDDDEANTKRRTPWAREKVEALYLATDFDTP